MRLTLRTLLAYLDDRLAPADARELGQKVAKSPFATELADRIRDVVRRRRLAQETPGQKTIDANLVAEYLDDQLTPELVALIEKEILSSDQSLAEVAAVHQTLGLLNDPVEISDDLKQRLNQLDPANVAADNEQATAEAPDAVEWKPLAPQSAPSNRSPLALLLVMVLGWLALLATDSHLYRARTGPAGTIAADQPDANRDHSTESDNPTDVAPQAVSVDEKAVPLVEDKLTGPPPSTPAADRPDLTEAQSPALVTDTGTPNLNHAAPPPAMAIADASATTPEPTDSADLPDNTAPSDPTSIVGSRPSADSPATSTKAPPVVAPVRIELQDEHSMLVIADAETNSWIWGSNLGVPPEGNWNLPLASHIAAVAEPFCITVTAPDAGWRVLAVGSSLFRSSSEGIAGIELFEGRLVLTRAAAENPQPFTLFAGGQVFSIGLPTGTNRIGILVSPIPSGLQNTPNIAPDLDEAPSSFDLLPIQHACMVSIFAAESPTAVTVDDSATPLTVPLSGRLVVSTNSDQPPTVSEPAIGAIPEWIFKATTPPAAATRDMIAATAEELRAEPSLTSGVSLLAANRNPEMAALAVKLPALTRQVNELCGFLIQAEEETVRREAIIGLQRIVRQSERGGNQVEASMSNRLSNMELENAMRLLNGITPTAAEDRVTSSWLIDMLSSNRLALRALAIFTLEELTNERYGYFAGDDTSRRESSVRRWKRLLERNDGRLPGHPGR